MGIDWTAIRGEFPSLAHWTYLNTATFGLLPRRATDAVTRHFAHRDTFACSDFLDWFSDADGLRELLARLINAQSADIAFLPASSHALSLLVGGIDWKPGDRVVTLEDEFPNQIYGPALLARRGVEFVEVPWERFYESIDERTKLVVLSTVSYLTGFRPPIAEIGRYLRERGVLLYLDGTQGLGALQYDMAELQPDIFAVHGYKWMLAPNGAAFMYVPPRVREWLIPNVIGWRSDRSWRDVDDLQHGAPQFGNAAEKYEGAMLAHSLLYAMNASVSMMLDIGPAEIENRVLDLAVRTRRVLSECGGGVLSGEHFDSPIVSARFKDHDASTLARELKSRRVLVSARHGRLRVSAHIYNDESDLERLREELTRALTRSTEPCG